MIYIPSTRLYSSGNSVAKEGKRAISDALSPPSPFLSLLSGPPLFLRAGEISRKCASHALTMCIQARLRGAFKILRAISYPASEHLYNTLYFLFPGVFPRRLPPPPGPDSFSPRVSRSSDFHIEGNRASP